MGVFRILFVRVFASATGAEPFVGNCGQWVTNYAARVRQRGPSFDEIAAFPPTQVHT